MNEELEVNKTYVIGLMLKRVIKQFEIQKKPVNHIYGQYLKEIILIKNN